MRRRGDQPQPVKFRQCMENALLQGLNFLPRRPEISDEARGQAGPILRLTRKHFQYLLRKRVQKVGFTGPPVMKRHHALKVAPDEFRRARRMPAVSGRSNHEWSAAESGPLDGFRPTLCGIRRPCRSGST